MEFIIKEHKSLSASGALPLLTYELGKSMLISESSQDNMLHASYRAVTAHWGDVLVGAIAFFPYRFDTCFWIAFGAVDAGYRRRGIYRQMWQRLVEIAQREGVATIEGATDSRNTEMLEFYKRAGRPVFGVMSRFVVPPTSDDVSQLGLCSGTHAGVAHKRLSSCVDWRPL